MKTLILVRVSGRISVTGFEITANYRVQLPRAEAEEENSYAGILMCFRGKLDIQEQILSLRRTLDRERSTGHWSLGDVGRERLGYLWLYQKWSVYQDFLAISNQEGVCKIAE